MCSTHFERILNPIQRQRIYDALRKLGIHLNQHVAVVMKLQKYKCLQCNTITVWGYDGDDGNWDKFIEDLA